MTVYDTLSAALRDDRPVALATVVEGTAVGRKLLVDESGEVTGGLGDPDLDRKVTRDAGGALSTGWTGTRRYEACFGDDKADTETVLVFVESFVAPPRMLIFGAVDFSAALVRVAKVLGYRVTVCDARAVFATVERFPEADEVVVDWPQRLLDRVGPTLTARDALCVLTHDARFDVPALLGAVATDVGYIGAMGSRRTHGDRVRRLKEAGIDDEGLARIHSPIGLDVGASTPEETAIAICAEIVAVRTGRDARPLTTTQGPIHAPRTGP